MKTTLLVIIAACLVYQVFQSVKTKPYYVYTMDVIFKRKSVRDGFEKSKQNKTMFNHELRDKYRTIGGMNPITKALYKSLLKITDEDIEKGSDRLLY